MITKDPIKAILIDLDGTLADSLPALYASYLEFLRERGIDGSQEEFGELNGPTLQEGVALLKNRYGWKEPIDVLLKDYYEIVQKHYLETMPLFPGVLDFLYYAKTKYWKIALVTTALEILAMRFLIKKNIEAYFDLMVTLRHVKRGKPYPDIYLRALSKLRLNAHEVIAIEDSPNGVKAALAANIATVQILHNKQERTAGAIPAENWDSVLKLFKEKYG